MKVNEKSQTIKIDIRSLGTGYGPGAKKRENTPVSPWFDGMEGRFFFENAYDAILISDSNGKILSANSRADNFFNYSAEGLVGLELHTVIAGMDEALLEDICKVISNGRYLRIQAFAIHRNGVFTAIEVAVMGSSKRQVEPIFYFIRDMHECWSAEQKLQSCSHALGQISEAVAQVDAQGVIKCANHAFLQLLEGRSTGPVEGRSLTNWFDRQAVVEPLLQCIKGGKSWQGRQQASDMWPEPLQMKGVPEIADDGELRGLTLLVSKAGGAQVDAVAADAPDVRRELADTCHALGQPATVLLSSIELLRMDQESETPERREVIELCYSAALQMRGELQRLSKLRGGGG